MTAEFATAARKLVVSDSAAEVGARAVTACDQVSQHLARLVGEIGVRTLLARSVALTSSRFAWLANAFPSAASAETARTTLEAAFAGQAPDVACDAFVDLLTTFVELLSKLIGESLVTRLLHEVWPDLFPDAVKELT